MTAYLPWLILLACPLMMVFMMRGMGGGDRTMGHDRMRRLGRSDGGPTERSVTFPPAMPPTGDDQARIAQLESEVAQLRATGGREPGMR
ncbi:MAG: DUF2933 domain-containing protein [Jatrophihabitantaceae bacterium]